MNERLLKSKMALHGDGRAELAKVLGIGEDTLSKKIQQQYDFKQGEIKLIAERYNLTADEIKEIFFNGGDGE